MSMDGMTTGIMWSKSAVRVTNGYLRPRWVDAM
ncbi:hypothetical protein LINPERPRIM_LOCUS4089 [Linum perenne]